MKMPPRCLWCDHWWDRERRLKALRVDRFCCDAYPDGIPADILDGIDQHLASRGDDYGLSWTPRQEVR